MEPRKRLRLGEMLVAAGLVSEDKLRQALAAGKRGGLRLGQQLVREGTVKESDIVDLISRQMGLAKYTPDRFPVDSNLAAVIPAEMALRSKLVPLSKTGNLIRVAMPDPLDISAIEDIEIYKNCEVEPVICTERELGYLTSAIYGMGLGIEGVLDSIEDMRDDGVKTEDRSGDVQVSSLEDMAGEAPVVRFVNSLLSQAVREGASDVHISPERDQVQIRMRIDGKLKAVPSPPKPMILPIVSRIKILANLDIAISRVPQDGRFTVAIDKREINIRVSTMPTIHGENLVLRLLDMSAGGMLLSDLGLSAEDLAKIRLVVDKPYGMFLATGPTGSGKSTTLFALLREISRPDINVITLEDPVEYRMEGVRQVQLNRRAGMTFASALRSTLRQDPDVVLVGEIRDPETAAIAVQAALTGHKVLSTVHTNDAAGAVMRLTDMGIEPFLVSSVLNVSIAQRLVRRICPNCAEPYTPKPEVLRFWNLEGAQGATFMRGRGCYLCGDSGFKGRVGLYEILVIDEDIQEMINKRATSREISRFAADTGRLKLLEDDARLKILEGKTTFEEASSAVML
ncbi:GspE/PulE family protein [Solidesulfovibrio sp.]|jgi:type IV pilus assembly protein PilB|uniref:GspE/PulE family protein n=1 Tax=Solidesulfovibrio sp. TaxID=2910990 RepID=UPI000EF12596|nr:ATPase, T2SS/T4P/T4SS family [Solidesulfovibrio sp.]MEA5087675.1 ATPase, T2SS/T4P/T4SS family [Solidesulfovibrio sp.]HCR13238.1 general secretion pathway protein GspE [Desulfovibrio sp.]HML60033.1 ATPase, T2SS/T4P/T4SS family [Solidesulfovibrio sp.]